MAQLESLRLQLLDHLRDLRALEAIRHARVDVDEGSTSWTSSEGERHTIDVWLGLAPSSLALLAAIPALHEHIQEAVAECTPRLPGRPLLGDLHLWWAWMEEPSGVTTYRQESFRPARRNDAHDIAVAMAQWSAEYRRWTSSDDAPSQPKVASGADRAPLGLLAPPGEISWPF